jgi:hypothetical protein
MSKKRSPFTQTAVVSQPELVVQSAPVEAVKAPEPTPEVVTEVVVPPPPAPEVNVAGKAVGSVVPTPVPPQPKLMDVDRMTLELARQRRLTALADAKTALAQSETAELSYKYVVLQLYMKYGLTDADAVSENGDIIKNGALQRPQGQVQ